jgi:ubiquinol-cytochrome c reductase cytochrome b subunit
VFGGEFPAQEIIPRLFVTHILIVPGAIAALIAVHLALIWRQKHTDFAGPGRRESNVVGPKLWPTYAAYSLGLFFAVFAVIMTMGGLVQVNPVWLYGPFEPAEVPSPAQPDWWLGWVEGALRIFPPWETRALGHEAPNPFYPGVLVPGVVFTVLYLWPFLEARFSGDRGPHHILDRARDHPVRTAIGMTGLSLVVLMQLAASNDLVAHWLDASVATITWVYRIVVLAVPPILGLATYRLMTALRLSGEERFGTLPLRAVMRPVRGPDAVVAEGADAAVAVDGAEVTVYEEPDGRWGWCYRGTDDGLELHSNKTFETAEAARRSAGQAFPEAPVVHDGPRE